MGGQAKGRKKNRTKRKDNRPNKDGGFVDLSPQERMKLRMHEKAKKKSAEKYTVHQLLEKTEECMDSFDFEMAGLFCQRALDLEPNNLLALDMLGHICSELGDAQKAKGQAFLRAVELSPDVGHSKYMYLGQIHTGQEAVDYYTKGIQILLCALDKKTQTNAQAGAASLPDEGSELPTAKDVCVAHCSIAEIYLTDLCMEEGAADKCREFIERALHYHHDNSEALQLMASYMFSTERNQEGREYLMKSVGSWLPARKQTAVPTSTEEDEQSEIPPYESRITTAKLLIETEEYEVAVDVLEGLLEEDDEVVQLDVLYQMLSSLMCPLLLYPTNFWGKCLLSSPQWEEGLNHGSYTLVWYLCGWVCYLQMEKAREGTEGTEKEEWNALKEAARSYLTNAKKLYNKLRCDDQSMLEHVEQLLGELGGEVEAEEGDLAVEEEYEPSSDEEEEEAPPMEH